MFQTVKQRWRDAQTIAQLSTAAETIAHEAGDQLPGAEHLVLAALHLPDGVARAACQRLGVGPDDFQRAVEQQYADALQTVGIDVGGALDILAERSRPSRPTALYQAQASAQTLMQRLAREVDRRDGPLLSAHVLVAATLAESGVVVRAFRVLGLEPTAVRAAAELEIARYAAAPVNEHQR